LANSPNKRILCVTSNFPRWKGDSTTPFVLRLAQDLQSLGWKVDVLAPHAEGTALRETIEGVSVERFRYFWPASAETICYKGGALVNLRKEKSNFLKLPFFVFSEWLAIRKKLKTGDYSLLHSHWILPQGFTGSIAARMHHIPHVLTVHGGDIFGLKGKFLQKFKKYSLSRADIVTVNSSVTEKAVKSIGDDNSYRIQRIPMGVSANTKQKEAPEIQAIRNRYRRGKGPLLLFVGRIVEEKGAEDLIHAVELLKNDNMDVTAMIIGEGQDRQVMEQLTERLGLGRHIYFLGWINPEVVGDYFSAGDVFIGPSRMARDGWIEAQGLTFLESMMAKTPVIATRSGGIIDSVVDGKTGILVNERAPDEIHAAVKRLVTEDKLYQSLAEDGLTFAQDNFSRESSAKKFSSLFTQLTTAKH